MRDQKKLVRTTSTIFSAITAAYGRLKRNSVAKQEKAKAISGGCWLVEERGFKVLPAQSALDTPPICPRIVVSHGRWIMSDETWSRPARRAKLFSASKTRSSSERCMAPRPHSLTKPWSISTCVKLGSAMLRGWRCHEYNRNSKVKVAEG
jgi:hypothetical protein